MERALQTPYAYRMLEALSKRRGRFTPATDLVASLGGTAQMVQQAVAALQRLGCPVAAHPVRGIFFRTPVDVIDRAEVAELLETRAFGRRLTCHLEVGSTNDLAFQAAIAGAPHGAVITAEHQTAGRGRRGRIWFSPPGTGLWCSVLLRPDLPARNAWVLTLGAAVATAGAVEKVAGCRPDLKWPNDVLLDGRKLGGMLLEIQTRGTGLSFAVVGIGLNVNQDLRDFPADLQETAVSLKMATGREQRRTILLAHLLSALEAVYAEPSPDRIRELWKARSSMFGQEVCVAFGMKTVVGVAEDLAQDGALVLRGPDGVRIHIPAGEVVQVR